MRFLFLISCIIGIASSCNTPDKESNGTASKIRDPQQRMQSWWAKVKAVKSSVKNGDLVTRTGADMISSSLCNFNKQDKTYSHSGLAFIENDGLYVYHTLSGDENPGDTMMREPFDSFCNPVRKNGFGLFRYDLSAKETDSLHAIIVKYYKQHIQFDTKFDLKDDSKMYCAEIIYKALKQCTQNRIILPTTTVRNFRFKNVAYRNKTFKELEYVAVDNLYLNPHCKEIARVKFD